MLATGSSPLVLSQIYSETEEVDNFGLFERSPEEEERDQRLALLMELRQFRQQNPEEFRRIKGLPLRARDVAPMPQGNLF